MGPRLLSIIRLVTLALVVGAELVSDHYFGIPLPDGASGSTLQCPKGLGLALPQQSGFQILWPVSGMSFQRLRAGLIFPALARISRPPGFDMTYRPATRVFQAPWRTRIPSLVYLGVTLVVAGVVLVAEHSPSNSVLYVQVVEHGSRHIISARTFAILLLVSSVSSVLRANMRGVRVRGDGIEYRDVVSLLLPRLRRFRWAQMDRIKLMKTGLITIDLWDGNRAMLPQVQHRDLLARTLEHVAIARAIPIEGGVGLDDVPRK